MTAMTRIQPEGVGGIKPTSPVHRVEEREKEVRRTVALDRDHPYKLLTFILEDYFSRDEADRPPLIFEEPVDRTIRVPERLMNLVKAEAAAREMPVSDWLRGLFDVMESECSDQGTTVQDRYDPPPDLHSPGLAAPIGGTVTIGTQTFPLKGFSIGLAPPPKPKAGDIWVKTSDGWKQPMSVGRKVDPPPRPIEVTGAPSGVVVGWDFVTDPVTLQRKVKIRYENGGEYEQIISEAQIAGAPPGWQPPCEPKVRVAADTTKAHLSNIFAKSKLQEMLDKFKDDVPGSTHPLDG